MAQNKLLYTFGKTILFPAYKLLYRFKVKNKGAVPPEGGVILASNHMSFADPVLLGLSVKRRLYFMAKQELFRNKFAGAVIRALGAFPVERGAGDGRAICALLAQQMQLPVVPCCITKKNFFHKFSKTIIHFGDVLTPEQLGLTPDGGRRELKNATGMIMDEIKKMREEDERELKNS